jgi:acyl carrier protein
MKSVDAIVAYLTSAVEDVTLGAVAASQVTPGSTLLEDLGLDSLDYASLMLMGEQWVGVKVAEDDVDWRKVATVEQLATLLYESQRADPA